MSEKPWSRRKFLAGAAAAGLAATSFSFGCFRPTSPTNFPPEIDSTDGILVTNVHLVDVVKGRIIDADGLWIRSGLIAAFLPKGKTPPDGLRTQDGKGGYLIPGLINAHAHLTLPSIARAKMAQIPALRSQIFRNYEDAIAWGITTVRDMGALPKFLEQDRKRVDRGQIPGPHILSPISFIAPPGGYPEHYNRLKNWIKKIIGEPSIYAENSAQARDCVKRLLDDGADFIKIGLDHKSNIIGRDGIATFNEHELDAIFNEAAKQGKYVACHHMYKKGLEQGLRFGAGSMEHLVSDAVLSDETVQRIVDKKMPLIPTAMTGMNLAYHTPEDPFSDERILAEKLAWRYANLDPDIPSHCIPRIAELCRQNVDFYETGRFRSHKFDKKLITNPAIFTRAIVNGTVNLDKLIRAGARLGVGNDAGVPQTFQGQLHFEIEILADSGMTPAGALRAATAENAKICRVDDICGTLDPGKNADLALLGKNPLVDSKACADVKAVWKKGVLISASDDFLDANPDIF